MHAGVTITLHNGCAGLALAAVDRQDIAHDRWPPLSRPTVGVILDPAIAVMDEAALRERVLCAVVAHVERCEIGAALERRRVRSDVVDHEIMDVHAATGPDLATRRSAAAGTGHVPTAIVNSEVADFQ